MGRKSKKQRILEAVKKLDVDNDDHWTDTGLPAMSAIEEIYGSAEIKREDVFDVVGGFKRGDSLDEEDKEPEKPQEIKEEQKPLISEYEYSKLLRGPVADSDDVASTRRKRKRHGDRYGTLRGKKPDRKRRNFLNG